MFIREADAKKLFKNAYKGVGLRLVNDGDGLIITGRQWSMQILDEYLPKEVKGAVITLTGELPDVEEELLCNKDGNQQEVYLGYGFEQVYRNALKAQAEGNGAMYTDVIISDPFSYLYRIYKDENGKTYLVPEEVCRMCLPSNCEDDENMYGCFAAEDGALVWLSDHMAFRLVPSVTEELQARLEQVSKCLTGGEKDEHV